MNPQKGYSASLNEYLSSHPETIISLAYFDMAVYGPIKACLEAISPHLIKGSVSAMDEINYPDYPGETIALKKAWGLKKYRIKRLKTFILDADMCATAFVWTLDFQARIKKIM